MGALGCGDVRPIPTRPASHHQHLSEVDLAMTPTPVGTSEARGTPSEHEEKQPSGCFSLVGNNAQSTKQKAQGCLRLSAFGLVLPCTSLWFHSDRRNLPFSTNLLGPRPLVRFVA
jgi:hypothetical protein